MYEIDVPIESELTESELRVLTDRVKKKLGLGEKQLLHFEVKQYPAIPIRGTTDYKSPSIRFSLMAIVSNKVWNDVVSVLTPYSTGIVTCGFYPTDVKEVYVDFDKSWIIRLLPGEPSYIPRQVERRMKEWGVKKWRFIREPYDKPSKIRLV